MTRVRRLAWSCFAIVMFHGLKFVTMSRVRAIDEGGLATLLSDVPIVIVANHQSHADTTVLHRLLPRKCRARFHFVASSVRFAYASRGAPLLERLERWFLRGLALHAYNAILVGGDRHGLRAVDDLAAVLRAREVVAMYPEGTRSHDGSIGALKPGVAMLAIATACKVVPVRLDGTREALPKSLHFPRLRNKICVRFRAPLTAVSWESHDTFLARLAQALEAPESDT